MKTSGTLELGGEKQTLQLVVPLLCMLCSLLLCEWNKQQDLDFGASPRVFDEIWASQTQIWGQSWMKTKKKEKKVIILNLQTIP